MIKVVAVLMIAIVGVGLGFFAWGSMPVSPLVESGTVSCNLPVPGSGNVAACPLSITFSPPFANVPIFTYAFSSNQQSNYTMLRTNATTYFAQAGNGSLAWRSFPVRVTNWMGLTGDAFSCCQNYQQVDWSTCPFNAGNLGGQGVGSLWCGPYLQQNVNNNGAFFSLQVGCSAQRSLASTGNEVIQLQVSYTDINGGGFNWSNVTGAQVNVSQATGCAWGYGSLSETAFIPLPPLLSHPGEFVRIVGWGGNGMLTDVVDFSFVKVVVDYIFPISNNSYFSYSILSNTGVAGSCGRSLPMNFMPDSNSWNCGTMSWWAYSVGR